MIGKAVIDPPPSSSDSFAALSLDFSIPNSVTSIGSHAFYNCNSLKGIVVPNSVQYIGDAASRGHPLRARL